MDRSELPLVKIAGELEIALSTAHRLVHTLASEGFINKDPYTKLYSPGVSILSLSHLLSSKMIILQEIIPIMKKLTKITGETSHICILDGTEVVYLHKEECPHPIRLLSHSGRRNPSYCTSSGQAILAYQTEEDINQVIKHGLYPYTNKTITNPDVFMSVLKSIKKSGYVISNQELHNGVISIGAPIFNANHEVIASINIAGPIERMTNMRLNQLVDYVKEASDHISKIVKKQNSLFSTATERKKATNRTLYKQQQFLANDIDSKSTLSSVKNAMKILRLFTSNRVTLGVTEISKQIGISKSSAHRLISTLLDYRFLQKAPNHQYTLGLGLLTLGGIVTEQKGIYKETLPKLEALVSRLGESAHLAVIEDKSIVYLHKIECDHPVRLFSDIGKRNPIYCTGSGLALLAFQSEENIRKMIENVELQSYTNKTTTNRLELQWWLDQIKIDGYVIAEETFYEGVVSIAAPIRDYTNEVIASVCVVGPMSRVTNDKYPLFVGEVTRTAERISSILGHYEHDD